MARPARIVVGYDGSESSGRALDRAAALAGYGTQLTVVSVAADPAGLEESRRLLRQASDRLLLAHALARLDERVGDPADELIAAVREKDADLLVVGNGKAATDRLPLGSVTTTLVHHAPCDVLVTR